MTDCIVSEEPAAGWQRFEVKGEKPYFKSPIPRMVIRDRVKLADYLKKEHDQGRMLDVVEEMFSFKRRLGLKRKKSDKSTEVLTESTAKEETSCSSIVDRLTKCGKAVDHKKLMLESCIKLDQLRISDSFETPCNFEEIKTKLTESTDLRDMLCTLSQDTTSSEALGLMHSDVCLTEICLANSHDSPLVEYPSSLNQNIYCQVVDFALVKCPTLLQFCMSMVVKRGEPVLPSHILKIVTLFSTICYTANHNLDALVKTRSLSMQVNGLSNIGLDIMSDLGLSHCARSLSNMRDLLADVGPSVMKNTASKLPYQSILDNFDFQSEHLTIEVIEKEVIDTSHLSSTKMSKEEALQLFTKQQLMLNDDANKSEKAHFMYLVGTVVSKLIGEARTDAVKLKKLLPKHHKHENSDRVLSPALTFIVKPHPFQETKNADTIQLLIKIQRSYLEAVALFMGNCPKFLRLLKLLVDENVDEETREAAEVTVKEACLKYGELILHGDLLTVKMVQEAMKLMSGSATAFGRLEFIGPCSLQLLHMKMKKVTQDYQLCMPSEVNYDDVVTLPWMTAMARLRISNKEKDIKKNDSSFELHDQWITTLQSSYLINMFDNYHEKYPERLVAVETAEDSISYALEMLEEFGIDIFYDGDCQESDEYKGDDLYRYCQVLIYWASRLGCFDVTAKLS